MKRILVMGGAVEQLPALKTAKRMGYCVGLIDYNPNAVGIPYADEYFNVSTIDVEKVTETAEKFKADGIITLATDMPMIAVANATEKLKIPGISVDTAIKCTNKYEMIKSFKEHNIESPWYYVTDSESDAEELSHKITYPCISKPVDNAASRGVTLVKSPEELINAYKYSAAQSRCKKVIIEEYMVGPEVSVEVIVYKGVPHILAVTDKSTSGAPHFVEVGHNQPSMLPDGTVEKIKNLASRAVLALGILNGPAHVEMIITKDGPKMVELGARLGGDCITSHLVRLSTGVDMIEETIKVLTGEIPDLEQKHKKGACVRFLTGTGGKLDYVEGIEQAEKMDGIREISMIMKKGDLLSDINSSDDRVAYVVSQADTPSEAIILCEKALNELKIHRI